MIGFQQATTGYQPRMTTDDFTPWTAIVTGSDSGIGRATAVALAQAGLDVGVTWHSDEKGGMADIGNQAGGHRRG